MNIEMFPGCCTARVLFDFGGSSAAMYRGEYIEAERLEVEYNKAIESHGIYTEHDDEDDYDEAEGNAVLVATTTTEQGTANEFLQRKGFLRVGPYRKPKHPETGLYLWWLPVYGIHGSEG